MLLRLLLKGLIANREYSLYFIFSFALGLFGLQLLFSTQDSINKQLDHRAQQILAGDLSVSTRRQFTDEELQSLSEGTKGFEVSKMISMFTMISSDGKSRLSYVKAVDEKYPLYGEITTTTGKGLSFESDLESPSLYADEQLLTQLNLKIGDLVQIGKLKFKIKDQILEDPAQNLRFSALAPKAYVSLPDLHASGLIGFGSTLNETQLIKVVRPDELLPLKMRIDQNLKDSSISIKTAAESAQDSIRSLRYLGDYLGLISLVGFLLSVIGAGFLFSRYLQEQLKTVAILNALGLQKEWALFFFSVQAFVLAAIASLVCLLLSYPVQQGLSVFISKALANPIQIEFSLYSFAFTFFISIVGSLLIMAPYFDQVWRLNPRVLLNDSEHLPQTTSRPSLVAISFLSLVAIWAAGLYVSQSFKMSFYFTSGLCLAGILIGGLGLSFIRGLNRFPSQMWRKVALWDLNGKIFSQTILITVISLSVMLIDSVNQIEHSIQGQLKMDSTEDTPAYFLFDIQDEQMASLTAQVKILDLKLLQPSPMIRAKLVSINKSAFERDMESDRFATREEEEEGRFRNRGLNLSYRESLQVGETLSEGAPLSSKYSGEGPVELSVEEDYAKRIGIKIGDSVEFNIQGLEVSGQVKNLRRVNWTRFLPNFFILTQPGFLEEAPKTWLAGLGRDGVEKMRAAQQMLAEKFPNVSLVDLDQVVQKIREITTQMSWALQFTAILVLIAGLFILFAMSRYHLHKSQRDLNLLKVLGATPRFIAFKIGFEYLTLVSVCSILGLLGSFAVSKLVLDRVFEAPLIWNFRISLLLIAGLLIIALIMTFIANRWAMKTEPKALL